jgi:hypothetical protein
MAERVERRMQAISEAPADPRLRKQTGAPTFYPGSDSIEGAAPLVLRSGERREGVDLRLPKAPAYCIEATLEARGSPAALGFGIVPLQPTSGVSSSGGMFIFPPGGQSGPDGKIRVCNLRPGPYRLTAYETPANASTGSLQFGQTIVTITDRDVQRIVVSAQPGLRVSGRVEWDGEPPKNPVTATFTLSLSPLTRAPFQGETISARCPVPGEFSFPGLFLDDFSVRSIINSPGVYVKDLTFAGHSILHQPLRLGSAMGGSELRVVLAHDGSTLGVRVTDRDNNPVTDAHIVILPAEIRSEAHVPTVMFTGQTDQDGSFTAQNLRPGKYLVLALPAPVDSTTETIGKLWRSRNKAKEADLAPNGSAQVTVSLSRLE